jgi:hypothetical protein
MFAPSVRTYEAIREGTFVKFDIRWFSKMCQMIQKWRIANILHEDINLQAISRVKLKKKINSVALVRKQTIPTERPPLVGEVSANF